MKSKAYGWLAAAVLAAGLNASYHDGGLEWAHRAIDGIGHNVSAVLALASGRADQFLAEARLLTTENVAANEPPSCRLATAWARIQTRMTQGQTRLARVQTNFIPTRSADTDMAQSQSARDRFEAQTEARILAKTEDISARNEAALARVESQRDRIEAETERHLQENIAKREIVVERMTTARLRPVAMQTMNLELGCRHLRMNVPQIEIPQVQVPQVHIPKIHIPSINVPTVTVDSGSGPV